ncbi:PTS system ascorbate-specific transporter subunit IIC [Streptococcus pneumoniae]|nr:PTS system ascorbate-specific transporter subunit IIC [Streptococcus pneumoniae]
MEVVSNVLNWFSSNILQNPAFFVGLLVLIGYALLKKPAHDVFSGFVKATVGYMLLNVGAGGLVTTFRPILAALNYKFQIGAAVIDPYFGLAAANNKIAAEFPDFVGTATTALLIGFGINILLVALRKITKVRTLFITGHIMVQQAATVSLMVLFLVPQLRNAYGTAAIGIICGLYWAVSSNMTVEATQRLTGGGGFAIGHQQQFAIWFVDKVAGRFGKKEESLDNLKLPKFLSIFHDTVVASATLMLVFFGAILLILGPDIMSNKEVITSGTLFNPAKQDFFMEFEELYRETQKRSVASQQKTSLNLDGQTISNGSQKLPVPKGIQAPSGQSITFDRAGGNSSLAKVEFQTSKGAIRYQLYLGNGKIKRIKETKN